MLKVQRPTWWRPLRRSRRWRPAMLVALALFCAPALLLLPMRWLPPPVTSYMLQSPVKPVRQHWVPAAAIGAQLPLAAIAAEDQKFPHHFGFDLASMQQAWRNRDQRRRGGSTISQQTAKNLFLWPGGYLRKALEAWITLWLELLWPKARIMEVYLNIAEFGPGIYGVGAGAAHHFGLPPHRLSRRQAAQLISVLPSPRRIQPNPPSAYVRERADWILRQMAQLGSADLDGWP